MKHFIIISLLVPNSVFSQLVLERTINSSDLGSFSLHIIGLDEPFIDKNQDFNGDSKPEILWGNGNTYYVIDLANNIVIDSIAMNSFMRLVTVENITCGTCNDIIAKTHPQNDQAQLLFGDFNNTPNWTTLGQYRHLIGIFDIDGDGLKEIVIDDYYNNVLEIYGNGITTASTTSINPSSFKLNQNYPNPFNPITSISYQVQLSGDVTLNIYDVLGNRIKTLIDEPKAIGDYEIKWDGTNQMGERLSSGQYFYQLKVGDFVSTKKMVLLK